MITMKFSQKVTNSISIFAVSFLLLNGALTVPSKAMYEVPSELEKISKAPNKTFTPESALQIEENFRCMRKLNRCWYKERTSTRIMHNIYTECTRGLECIWNAFMCRGCKNNRRLEKELKEI